MPGPEIIREGLRMAVADFWYVALIVHLLAVAWLTAAVLGWRPSRPRAAAMSIAPLVAVSAVAWLGHNPFNGALFALLAGVLATLAPRMRPQAVAMSRDWPASAGALMIAFGWVYPHFLQARSLLDYFYLAPAGVIPCPTLSLIIGVTLLLDGLGSRAWSLCLAGAGLLYGFIGVLYLGVWLDLGLVLGALALAAHGLRLRDERALAARALVLCLG